MSKKSPKRLEAREIKRSEILDWYLASSGGVLPSQQCEDKKAYGDRVEWWLEPPIPGCVNPKLVEYSIGDGWAIEIVPLPGTGVLL